MFKIRVNFIFKYFNLKDSLLESFIKHDSQLIIKQNLKTHIFKI